MTLSSFKLKNKLNSKQLLFFVGCAIFITTLLNCLLRGKVLLFGDTNLYWTFADSMFTTEPFSLYNFPHTYRGYFLPMFFSGLKIVSSALFHHEFLLFFLLTSIMMAVLWTVIFPFLFSVKQFTRSVLIGMLVSYCAVLFFWGDFLRYPLSDFWALFSMFLAAALLKYISQQAQFDWKVLLFGFLAGACIYIAYNTRTIYLYGAAAQLIWFAVVMREKLKELLFYAILLLAGAALVCIPQVLLNGYHTNQYTPRVMTEYYGGESLENLQIYWGLEVQKYETYVGDGTLYPSAGVRFESDLGHEILEREKLTPSDVTYGKVIELFFKYPLEMITIYATHLFAYLTPFYTEIYLHDLYANKTLIVTLGILIWLIGALAIHADLVMQKAKTRLKGLWVLCGALVPVVLLVAGAPENRFYVALYWTWYFYLGCCINWRNVLRFFKKHVIQTVLIVLVGFVMWVTIAQGILNSNTTGIQRMIIGDGVTIQANTEL